MMGRMIAVEKNIHQERYNPTFIFLVMMMAGFGIAVLYSGSLHYAERFFGDPLYFVIRQLRNLLAGFCFSLFSALTGCGNYCRSS